MKIGKLLERINSQLDSANPQIDRHTVNYYVRQGFLKPRMTRSKRGFVQRWDFSEEDLRVSQIMWRYRLEGVVPRAAFARAQSEKDQGRLPLP